MGLGYILAFGFLFAVVTRSSATTLCSVDGGRCTFTVTCIKNAGTISNPACSGEPNVTFVMTLSNSAYLNAAFFGSTNFDSKVRIFKAISNSWFSISGYAFRYYSKTTHIDLSNNAISNIDDEAFKNLVFLQFLNLSRNYISVLNPGVFLISDTDNTQLTTLDLSFNRIQHIPQDALSHVPSLISLYLQGNGVITMADNCFGTLKYLRDLQLQNNSIETLNITLINLRSLTNLDLAFNSLKQIYGYQLNRLFTLETLNMSHNNIISISSDSFTLNLTMIDLSYNSINGIINNGLFSSCTNLKYLNLYSNNITGLEESTFQFNKLNYLNLEKNNISGEIRLSTFTGLKNISKLDLSEQNISTLRNNVFADMTMLLHLNLSRNQISLIENFTFYNSSLSILDLSHNKISELNFFNNTLYNLTEVYLNDNNITVLHKNTFQQQTLIKKLNLSENNIFIIEGNSLPLQNLQYFSINNNKLTGNLKSNTLSPAKFLRFLDLSRHNISRIGNFTFIDMPVLARLNLSHNRIEQIMPSNFEGMDNLYSIDISYNKLSDLQFNNSLLTSLKVAYLNNNKLTNVSRIFPRTTKLLYLDMSQNGLTDLLSVDSNLFPELQTLYLSYNNITKFNNPRTNSLTNLLHLELSSNKISEIDLSYFKQLMVVDLSNNSLRVINNTFFRNVDVIQSLDLSRNSISDLPPGTFQNMKNLKLLNLSSNAITKLRFGSLKGLHRTELLDISSNKIECLDVHVFHECTELRTLIIDYNQIKTLDVERLALMTQRNLKTVSLGGNPISCQEIIRNVTRKDLQFFGIYQVEITSIHKIYHEDNVHGIKCGKDMYTTTAKAETTEAVPDNGSSSLIVVWCTILTIVVVVAISVAVYFKLKKRFTGNITYRDSRVMLRNSVELGSDYSIVH